MSSNKWRHCYLCACFCQQRKATDLAKRQTATNLPYTPLRRSKSARVSSPHHHQSQQQQTSHGFAPDLNPKDPRYCPFGFGSACRRDICLTADRVQRSVNTLDATVAPWKMITSTRENRQQPQISGRMSQSAMTFRNASVPNRKPLSNLQPTQSREPVKASAAKITSDLSRHPPKVQTKSITTKNKGMEFG